MSTREWNHHDSRAPRLMLFAARNSASHGLPCSFIGNQSPPCANLSATASAAPQRAHHHSVDNTGRVGGSSSNKTTVKVDFHKHSLMYPPRFSPPIYACSPLHPSRAPCTKRLRSRCRRCCHPLPGGPWQHLGTPPHMCMQHAQQNVAV